MPKVRVALGERSYWIKIETGLLSRAGQELLAVARRPKLAVVAQRRVWDLWGERFSASLKACGADWSVHTVPNGEAAKTLNWLHRLYSGFARAGVDRRSMVVAFGGGAVGDLAGFAAATWMRGVDFAQIPTTLLAQVDASVGGKVAVNITEGKNLVGAFWQPRVVLMDPMTLETLPPRDLRSGLAEVIKYGVILDADFLDFICRNRRALLGLRPMEVSRALKRCCELKASVVRRDERESGMRVVLNYGHTVGHAVEAVAGYRGFRHGETVAIGMVAANELAKRTGRMTAADAEHVRAVISDYGLPCKVPANLPADRLVEAMGLDKKASEGRLRFVLPIRLGEVVVADDVTPEMVRDVVLESQSREG